MARAFAPQSPTTAANNDGVPQRGQYRWEIFGRFYRGSDHWLGPIKRLGQVNDVDDLLFGQVKDQHWLWSATRVWIRVKAVVVDSQLGDLRHQPNQIDPALLVALANLLRRDVAGAALAARPTDASHIGMPVAIGRWSVTHATMDVTNNARARAAGRAVERPARPRQAGAVARLLNDVASTSLPGRANTRPRTPRSASPSWLKAPSPHRARARPVPAGR